MSYICNILMSYVGKIKMSIKPTLEGRVCYRINRSKSPVFIRRDFEDIGGYDQIGRVLKGLVRKGRLLNIGYGAYARAKKSRLTDAIVPEEPLPNLAKELMKKLGVKTAPSRAEVAYNSGRSTQVPTGRVVGVKKRVARRIGYKGKTVSFEKVS